MNILAPRATWNEKDGLGKGRREGKRLERDCMCSLYGETPTIGEKIHGGENAHYVGQCGGELTFPSVEKRNLASSLAPLFPSKSHQTHITHKTQVPSLRKREAKREKQRRKREKMRNRRRERPRKEERRAGNRIGKTFRKVCWWSI